jgi:hypothetical protein
VAAVEIPLPGEIKMKIVYSIFILLVCFVSPEANAQEAAKKFNYSLLLNISVLEINLDPSEDLETVAHDRARVAALLAEGKGRKIAITQMHVRPGETSRFRIGNKVPIQVGSFPSFNRPAERNVAPGQFYSEPAPTIQYEEIGLLIEALPEMISEDVVDIHLKVEIKDIDRSTGTLTPSIPLKFLNSRALLRLNESVALLGVNGSWLSPGRDIKPPQPDAGATPNLVVLLTVRKAD